MHVSFSYCNISRHISLPNEQYSHVCDFKFSRHIEVNTVCICHFSRESGISSYFKRPSGNFLFDRMCSPVFMVYAIQETVVNERSGHSTLHGHVVKGVGEGSGIFSMSAMSRVLHRRSVTLTPVVNEKYRQSIKDIMLITPTAVL